MKIIILEGIATSGKTSVKNKLIENLNKKGLSFSIIEEDETLLPILDNKDKQISVDLLREIIIKKLKEEKDFIIFDRLFFTHIFRTNSSIKDFEEIENLLKNNSLLIFLKIDELKIPERINTARNHRDKEWNDYVDKKGTNKEIYQYYIKQQRLLLNLLDETSLKYKIFDTTQMDFENIANEILKYNEVASA
ncbi:MAG: hypothetical protein UR66_C0003G0078 [Candidatus Moranbacteria bacterium GW2011_GWE1_35_17]|nr:MAG: hypothetical protein UR66_C0003G0078 [Candidatus Moranbacteria bacterium GW2011_GWE1_35_17]KKP82512.1 MAG: hypothetical protein UR82_C0037G0009 [Candidatus Moranbacteria bacterium GW2011_GWF1_35_5]